MRRHCTVSPSKSLRTADSTGQRAHSPSQRNGRRYRHTAQERPTRDCFDKSQQKWLLELADWTNEAKITTLAFERFLPDFGVNTTALPPAAVIAVSTRSTSSDSAVGSGSMTASSLPLWLHCAKRSPTPRHTRFSAPTSPATYASSFFTHVSSIRAGLPSIFITVNIGSVFPSISIFALISSTTH